MTYDADYYERGVELGISGYTSYRWMPEMTIPLAHEIVTQLGIEKHERIMDFGCAKGYLVKALRLLHHDAMGLDISEYALSQAPEDVKPYLKKFNGSIWDTVDWIIAKDVLEHVSYEELPALLYNMRGATNHLFIVVPLGDGKKYVIPEYEKDTTHVIREGLDWWREQLQRARFELKLASTYMPNIKENWARYEGGNGFFIAEAL